jgi:hypothetical protein
MKVKILNIKILKMDKHEFKKIFLFNIFTFILDSRAILNFKSQSHYFYFSEKGPENKKDIKLLINWLKNPIFRFVGHFEFLRFENIFEELSFFFFFFFK